MIEQITFPGSSFSLMAAWRFYAVKFTFYLENGQEPKLLVSVMAKSHLVCILLPSVKKDRETQTASPQFCSVLLPFILSKLYSSWPLVFNIRPDLTISAHAFLIQERSLKIAISLFQNFTNIAYILGKKCIRNAAIIYLVVCRLNVTKLCCCLRQYGTQIV